MSYSSSLVLTMAMSDLRSWTTGCCMMSDVIVAEMVNSKFGTSKTVGELLPIEEIFGCFFRGDMFVMFKARSFSVGRSETAELAPHYTM